jgi:hypothetical protein
MCVADISLTKVAEVGQILSGFASVTAVEGLFFVWKQVRLQQRNTRAAVVTGLTTLITDVDQVFIDRPELWKYFNESEPPPKKGDEVGERVRAVAMTMANVLDHIVEHRGEVKSETSESWRRYAIEVYVKSPAFREVLTEHSNWWPGLQRQICEAAVTPEEPKGPAARPAGASL